MSLLRGGSLWLFRLLGVDVYVHWSWLLVGIFEVHYRARFAQNGDFLLPIYDLGRWYWIEFLSFFAIVLLHEFGHALACRRVGGFADEIVIWPLGGITFVRPPARPGAILWTASAGPLVNVLLVPVLGALWLFNEDIGWSAVSVDLPVFLKTLWFLNLFVLIFNVLPVYPLDGGQMLQAFLWFFIGRADSMMVVSLVGMLVGGGFLLLGLLSDRWPLLLLAFFVLFTSSAVFRHGRTWAKILSGPRRKEVMCPACKSSPLVGNYWTCNECGTRFDIFQDRGQCPGCGQLYRTTKCPECYQDNPIGEWFGPSEPRPSDS
jgi:Zn-dependent protease